MIKIKYNSNTGQILGNYPANMNYPSITIDDVNKTITDQSGIFPYIEITEEQHEEGMGKNMVVVNGNYQEYVKTSVELLQEAKNNKIQELTTYHNSDEVRILTINGVFKVTTDYESSRQYFSELVNKSINSVNAKNDIQRLAGKVETHTTDNVIIDWLLNGQTVQVPVTMLRIAQYQIGEIVDNNYLQFETHSVNIKNIADLENNPLVENEVIQDRINQINSYDFTAGYLKNQALNFTI